MLSDRQQASSAVLLREVLYVGLLCFPFLFVSFRLASLCFKSSISTTLICFEWLCFGLLGVALLRLTMLHVMALLDFALLLFDLLDVVNLFCFAMVDVALCWFCVALGRFGFA